MSYKITVFNEEEALPIKKLAELLEAKNSTKVVFIDVVSVEKKQNKHYGVKWIGRDTNALKKYYNLITNFFREAERESLLFLKPHPPKEDNIHGINTRVVHFNNISKSNNCSNDIDLNRFLEASFLNRKVEYIDTLNESQHINNWQNEILSKMCVSSAVFAKIDFTIAERDFVAAIWVGFEGNTEEKLFSCDFELKPHIENFLWGYSSKSIASELIFEAQQAATRTAISQDQARTGSHNIGSHVLNRLTDLFNYRFSTYYSSSYSSDKMEADNTFAIQKLVEEISSKEEEVDDKYNLWITGKNKLLKLELKPLSGNKDCDAIIKWANKEHLRNVHSRNLLYNQSRLNNYIKCRMEYLSDISFGIPAMQMTKHLKSEIISELDDVRMLLENISGLSNFKYTIEVKCDFDDDPAIAIPNDTSGNQALFNIIENVIRNTAKHSDKSNIDDPQNGEAENKVIKFTLDVKEINTTNDCPDEIKAQVDLLYEVLIYDNIIIEGVVEELTQKEKNDYNRDTGNTQSSISMIDYLVYTQNKKLNDSILKEDNTLRSTALGLIEMEAATCYLRKIDVSSLEEDDYIVKYNDSSYNDKGKINLLKAIKVRAETQPATTTENYYFGYRFFVLKPAEVLLIGCYELSDELKNNGFLCFSLDSFQKEIEFGKVFNHQFLVYDTDETKLLIDITENVKGPNDKDLEVSKYKALLPKRIMKLTSTELDLRNNQANGLMKLIWEKWASQEKFCGDLISIEVPRDICSKEFHLLNHGESELSKEQLKLFNQYFEADSTKPYIEALSKEGKSKLPEFNKHTKGLAPQKAMTQYYNEINQTANSHLYFPIIESAKARIILIDERVQYAAYNQKYGSYDFCKYYQHSNIIVPDMELDLGANDLSNIISQIEQFIKGSISADNYLVIHYSILERFFNKSNDKELDVHKWLNEYCTKTNVIVTSGRGTLKNLPPAVQFVNLSPLLAAVVDFRSKYYLQQIIMSSRKPNKK